MNLKYAVFDLDGTLLDSLHVWKDVDEKFLGRRGIEVPTDYFAAIRAMKFYDTAIYTINRFGLSEDPYELFQSFTTLKEVQRGKGFPDIYLKAASKLSCKPCECAVFEDILPGIEAAKGAGFYTVGVFEECAREEIEQIMRKSDLYIESFKDLLCLNNLFFTK